MPSPASARPRPGRGCSTSTATAGWRSSPSTARHGRAPVPHRRTAAGSRGSRCRTRPAVDLDDPDVQFVDLDGDGLADLLVTEGDAADLVPVARRGGLRPRDHACPPRRRGQRARLVLSDGTSSVHLADMSGDGLADLVRIRNGEVSYWPNLGYGRFGARITMDGAPWFDPEELFDPRRLRLADVGRFRPDRPDLPRRRRGPGPPQPTPATGSRRRRPLPGLPPADATWTRSRPSTCSAPAPPAWSGRRADPDDARRSLRYADLTGGVKPHLLERVDNNLGARDRDPVRPVHPVLPRRRGRRPALADPAAVPGAGGGAGGDLRPGQREPVRHAVRLPPRLLRRHRPGVPRLRPDRAVGHRGTLRPVPGRPVHGRRTWIRPRTCRRC